MTPAGLAPLGCPVCGRPGDPYASSSGCVACADAGRPVNLVCATDPSRVSAALLAGPGPGPGVWAWAGALPVAPDLAVSLGEGGTPLVPVPRLGAALGVPELRLKVEAANPTWSHKDRLAALGVAAARALGAETVSAASSGNHGIAVAAYAARAGLRCVVFTPPTLPAPMSALLRSYDAEVVVAHTADERYVLMADGIASRGWYPVSNARLPPIGSSPYGVDGYKTIAYELCADLGHAPAAVIVPVALGDLLAGIHLGFTDLLRAGVIDALPRLVGAEVTGALGAGLRAARAGRAPTPVPVPATAALSIASGQATRQAVDAVSATGGTAVTVSEQRLTETRHRLARTEGLLAEAASCAAVAAAADIGAPADATVVAVLTASGLKDTNP